MICVVFMMATFILVSLSAFLVGRSVVWWHQKDCEGRLLLFWSSLLKAHRLKVVDYSIIFGVQCKVVCNLMYANYLDVFSPWMFLQSECWW